MRVAYLIFSNEHGTGGHHHSMKAVKDSLHCFAEIETFTINIGVARSPVIRDDKNYVFFRATEFNIIYNLFRIARYCKKNNISILHAYDVNAYFYVRVVSLILRIPSVYTKCGGENNKYNPQTVWGVTISGENYDYLLATNKHERLYLYENRVTEFEQNHVENEKVRKRLKIDNKRIFLRITRVTKYYRDSIMKTVSFVSMIENSVLVFLGSIYDQELKQEILKYAKTKKVLIQFLSDSKYITNSRQYIGIGDYVFGSGRSAMEVLGARRKLLAFAKNSSYPIFVNSDNFDYFRHKNFSERVELPIVPPIELVVKELLSVDEQSETPKLYEKFRKHYLISARANDYKKLYIDVHLSKKFKMFFWDFLRNAFYHILRSSASIKYVLRIKNRLRL